MHRLIPMSNTLMPLPPRILGSTSQACSHPFDYQAYWLCLPTATNIEQAPKLIFLEKTRMGCKASCNENALVQERTKALERTTVAKNSNAALCHA